MLNCKWKHMLLNQLVMLLLSSHNRKLRTENPIIELTHVKKTSRFETRSYDRQISFENGKF